MTGGVDFELRGWATTTRWGNWRKIPGILIAALTLSSVVAVSAIADAASITATWSAPTTNANGTPLTDLGSYRLYLGTSTPSCPGGSFLTVGSPTSAPPSGQVVSSRVTALSAGTTYFLRITAVDTSGNESSCSASASGVAQPDFSVTPTATTNFGSLAVGSSADATFTVQNASTSSITGSASVGAPYSILSGGSFSLAAGASQTVTVRFRPTAGGTFAGNVNFTANGDTVSRVITGTGTTVPTAALSVTTSGTGAGTVTSTPAGISCGASCSTALPIGTPIALTATPASGSTFMGWSGACSGTGACAWTMTGNAAVTATFDNTRVDRPMEAASVPVVSNLSPATATAGSPALTLTVNGSGFAASSVVRWSGANRTTTVVSATRLTAVISAADLASARSVSVAVFTPTPGGGTSNNATFTVAAAPAAPTSSSLSPTSAAAGSAALTLTVNGSRFVSSSVVRWDGADRTTTFVSASQLRAVITAADLATARTASVTVFTPAPGGGTSAARGFTVTAPPAAPASLPAIPINPSVTLQSTDASGATFAITWPATAGATSYTWIAAFSDGTAGQQGTTTGASLQLRMPYHASGAAVGGFVCVRATNAAGPSADQACSAVPVPARVASLPAPVTAPAPSTSSLSPSSAVAGSTALTLTVSGSNFVSSSVVRWNGADRGTTFVSASELRAAITAADLAATRTVPVTVFTPAPGGGTSASRNFAVTAPASAPAPSTSSLSPSSAVAGSAALTLTVNGSNFVSSSVVRWSGADRSTTFVSASELRAAITAADLATARTVSVTVFTPAPGGGTAASRNFTVTAPPAAPAPTPSLPTAPSNLSVTPLSTDASGATFTVAWSGVSGATSYRYTASFADGSAAQQGTVNGLVSFQLRMPYHASGAASTAGVCLRSVSAAGQSADQACAAIPVPGRPVTNPSPIVSSLSPASATAGGPSFTLTVNGSGFVNASVVRWNGAARTTTFVSATQLSVAIAAADIASARSVPVTVVTPSPGGGTSGARSFTVTAPPAAPAPPPAPPASSTPPPAPSAPAVRLLAPDAGGATYVVTWGAVSGATSYRWVAKFNDGSAQQGGTVSGPSLQLWMPYHASGAAFSGSVCIRSVNAAGVQSTAQACGTVPVPAFWGW